MFKWLIIILLILKSGCSFTQNDRKAIGRKNEICFETGFWNRGFLEFSYTRNFGIRKKSFWSTSICTGIGPTWTDLNSYLTANVSYNIGMNNLFFVLGIDAKHMNYTIDHFVFLGSSFDAKYTGLTANPNIGFRLHGERRLAFELRLSPLFLFENNRLDRVRPSAGIRLGYAF